MRDVATEATTAPAAAASAWTRAGTCCGWDGGEEADGAGAGVEAEVGER